MNRLIIDPSSPNTGKAALVLPKNHIKKRIALMKWFREMDAMLVSYVTAGNLKLEMAQAYFMLKVETDPHLAKADKQTLANESKVWRIPNPNL